MLDFLLGILTALFDFLSDLWLVRRLRRARRHPPRSLAQDATQLAVMEWYVLPLASTLTVAVGLSLYLTGLHGFWCIALPGLPLLWFAFVQYRRRLDL